MKCNKAKKACLEELNGYDPCPHAVEHNCFLKTGRCRRYAEALCLECEERETCQRGIQYGEVTDADTYGRPKMGCKKYLAACIHPLCK